MHMAHKGQQQAGVGVSSHAMVLLLMFLLPLVGPVHLHAQGVVPFVSPAQEFIIFDQGRFERVEPRPPRQFHRIGGRVLYEDHEGRLKLYTVRGTRVAVLDQGPVRDLATSATLAAWRSSSGSTVLLQGDRAIPLPGQVGAFSVGDSLLLYHDMDNGRLLARWRGREFELAGLEGASERPQWAVGANTAVFHDRRRRSLHMFHRGELRTLCEGTDVARVAPGLDMVAYVHGDSNELRLFSHGADRSISFLPAIRFATGLDMVGFIDHGGRLMAHRAGRSFEVADSIPGLWEVRDSLLLFVRGGGLHVAQDRGSALVVPYVPEQWEVAGGTLHYLDLDRRLWRHEAGERERVVRDISISAFQLHGDAMLLREMDQRPLVLWKGKRHAY